MLDGFPQPPGKPSPVQFFRGEDIIFDIYLNNEGNPVLLDDWQLFAVLKSSVFSSFEIWRGTINNGILKNNNSGYYKFCIPAQVFFNLPSGTYWLDIYGKEQINRSGVPFERTVLFVRQPFSVDTSAMSSSNPISIDQQSADELPNQVDPKLL